MKPVPSLRLSLWYKRKEGAQTQTDVDEIQIHNKELAHGKRKHRQAELHLNGGGGGGGWGTKKNLFDENHPSEMQSVFSFQTGRQ